MQTDAGHTITDTLPDILTAHTPDPLYPHDVAQTHYWWAGWQVVPHSGLRTAMPEGEYRLHVYGHVAADSSDTWPYETAEYSLTSESFTVTPAAISLALDESGISASIDGSVYGYRLIDLEGSSTGANPVRDAALRWILADGSTIEDETTPTIADGRTHFSVTPPEGAIAVEVSDPDGNIGTLEIE